MARFFASIWALLAALVVPLGRPPLFRAALVCCSPEDGEPESLGEALDESFALSLDEVSSSVDTVAGLAGAATGRATAGAVAAAAEAADAPETIGGQQLGQTSMPSARSVGTHGRCTRAPQLHCCVTALGMQQLGYEHGPT